MRDAIRLGLERHSDACTCGECKDIAGYQISYRTTGKLFFYLPLYTSREYANPLLAATVAFEKFKRDFPAVEWRMQEVWS